MVTSLPQELVNLLLTGRAVSNTFNDNVILDSGSAHGDSVTLKGLSGRSEVGLLSLFEHYKSCQVREVRFRPKVGQIGHKWDKSVTFSDQISVHFGALWV